MESMRFFAEECDNLATVQVFADMQDGFGGLSCSLLRALREEYTRVSLPVWGFSEATPHSHVAHEAHSVGGALHSLGLPYCYSELSESASMVVPIEPHAAHHISHFVGPVHEQTKSGGGARWWTPYHTSAVIASAIEAASSTPHFSSPSLAPTSMQEMEFGATRGGNFPIVALEVAFPFSLAPDAAYDQFWDAFSGSEPALTLNPFSRSLSAAAFGSYAVSDSDRQRRGRAYANMLSGRGAFPVGESYSATQYSMNFLLY